MTDGLAGLADRLSQSLSGVVEVNRPLARLTTYRLGGNAAIYVEPADADDLDELGRALKTSPGGVPVVAIGRGSNIVVSDHGWAGVAVRLPASRWSWITEPEPDDTPGVRAGGATSLPLLANWAARRGLSGVEFLVAVPGSVGGAVRMNAGAHGREIKDCLARARVFDLGRLETIDRRVGDLDFSYRHSRLTERHLVLDATLALEPAGVERVRAKMESYRRHRAETQPGAIQNAGSVFRNPPGDHAGRLVEAAGLKGFGIGGASVSDLHANFFVAENGASAQDVYDLVHAVRARVREEFGVDLVPEVKFVGDFDSNVGEDTA
jgi:UDP-N-acetylmuramate dehydrogenase